MSTIPLAYQKPLSGERVGVVFGSFAPLHQGHLDMIFRAKKENDGGCLVIVCGNDGDKGGDRLPLSLRYRYVREYFKDDDLVAVYAVDDGKLGFTDYAFENWYVWNAEFCAIENFAIDGFPELTWYVGEKAYYDDLTRLGRECILMERKENPISGTMIRENPLKYWDKIALPFRRAFSHNILIIGTASEGKSILTMDLAKYFGTAYAHEWPRDYMEKYSICDWNLTKEDFYIFLHGQHMHIKEQMESLANRGVFFADSDAITTDMYAWHYAKNPECTISTPEYGDVSLMADIIIGNERWNKIFLLPPHGVFVDDHSRYMHDADLKKRETLYRKMHQTLWERNSLWENVQILDGNYQENFETIKRYVIELYRKAGIYE